MGFIFDSIVLVSLPLSLLVLQRCCSVALIRGVLHWLGDAFEDLGATRCLLQHMVLSAWH